MLTKVRIHTLLFPFNSLHVIFMSLSRPVPLQLEPLSRNMSDMTKEEASRIHYTNETLRALTKVRTHISLSPKFTKFYTDLSLSCAAPLRLEPLTRNMSDVTEEDEASRLQHLRDIESSMICFHIPKSQNTHFTVP